VTAELAGLDDVDSARDADAEDMPRTRYRVTGLLVPRKHWRSLAACQSADPDLFFPISPSGPSGAQVAQAKAICAGCPVRQECLAFALRTQQVYGVWGGLTEQERYPLISSAVTGAGRGQAEHRPRPA
jgi:WhiB family redox-sensing transcriptional regulator